MAIVRKKGVSEADRKRQRQYELNYQKRKPWYNLLRRARRRCRDKRSKWFKFYGAKGIGCFLTLEEIEAVWKRDGADKLKRPSLDRIDAAKGYSFENVQIIEFNDNARIAWDPSHRDTLSGVKTNGLAPDTEETYESEQAALAAQAGPEDEEVEAARGQHIGAAGV